VYTVLGSIAPSHGVNELGSKVIQRQLESVRSLGVDMICKSIFFSLPFQDLDLVALENLAAGKALIVC
jgi:hypothetical protein